jgi:hypothetical protein
MAYRGLSAAAVAFGFVGAVFGYIDSRHVASGFSPDGVRLGLGHHGWLWWHYGEIGFALIAAAFLLEFIAIVCFREH